MAKAKEVSLPAAILITFLLPKCSCGILLGIVYEACMAVLLPQAKTAPSVVRARVCEVPQLIEEIEWLPSNYSFRGVSECSAPF